MDVKSFLHAVRSGWLLLVAGIVVGVAVAGALTWTATPLYSSTTRLFVSVAGSTDASAAYQSDQFSQARVASYAQLLTSEELAAKVAEHLGQDLSPTTISREVTARALPQTVLLDVTVTDPSAQRAQLLAQTLGSEFIDLVAELETPEGADASTVKVTTVQPAQVNSTPVSPQRTRNLALGAMLGLLVGLGLALLRARLDNAVRSDDDVRALTGVGLIGTVLEDSRLARTHVVADFDDQSAVADSFRAIRTNLEFLDVANPPKVIVVTSSVPEEGKTTLAVNLATALAQSGSRVVLVDADLRRPRVTDYMGLRGGTGLTDVLAGTADPSEVMQLWGNGKLGVLAAGPMPANPSEALGSAQMRSLIATLRDSQDHVVLNAPPLLAVTDAAVLSVLADGCIIATRYGKTRRELLSEATAILARIDAKLLGVVMNRVPPAAALPGGYGYGGGLGRRASRRSRLGRRHAVGTRPVAPALVPVPLLSARIETAGEAS